MRWLRRFFYSDDPTVKLVAGVSEPQAGIMRELLENNGIPSFAKNMNWLSVAYHTGGLGNDWDIFVRRSDLARAREVLGLDPGLPLDRNGA